MNEAVEQRTVKKLFAKLIPILGILYFVAFLDRANISIAALTMNKDLGISAAAYGMGAGIFFIGYFIFEIPSNIILAKVGARRWITRILVTWGIISTCFMFVQNETQMLVLRFFLGVAEAGFYPGVIYYISTWFPVNQRARATASFHCALPVAVAVGNVLGGLFLQLDGIAGLRGWQWLFLCEGIPSVLLGYVSWKYLLDSPKDATWLADDEKEWLMKELASAETVKKAQVSIKEVFAKPAVWLYSLYYLIMNIGFYGITFFLPQIVKKLSGSNPTLSSLYSAIPWIAAIFAMLWIGKYVTKAPKKKPFIVIPMAISSVALLAASYSPNLVLSLVLLAICISTVEGAVGPFWGIPQKEFGGVVGAAAIANINALGNLGGFFGPVIFGIIIQASGGDFQTGIIVMAGFLFASTLIAATFKER